MILPYNMETLGELVAHLQTLDQSKPFVIVDCGANEEWTLLSVSDTDTEEVDPEDNEDRRSGVIEFLIDSD